MQTFYNTISLNSKELHEAILNAASQEIAIMEIYRTQRKYTPSEILKECEAAGRRWPITSIRRAITNLRKRGELIDTGEQKDGPYGMPEGLWVLNPSRYKVEQKNMFQ